MKLGVMCGAALVSLGAMLSPRWAGAATVCSTVAEFNTFMIDNAAHSEDVTLTFDVVGVNPSHFHNGKGSLAQMRNTACSTGQDSVIKVYGTSEPLNTAHMPGTLKLEYGNSCCGGVCEERWADPNASEPIFADGSEACKVTMWNRPDSIGYKLECNNGTYEAVGDNPDHNVVDRIALLEYYVSDGGKTWELDNATASNDQVCYVTVDSGVQSLTVSVNEDVTVGPAYASTVFPDATDLAVEAADNQAYLKFVVPPIDGKITDVRLVMHTRPESSAEGDGGDVYAVSDSSWSEATLTWDARPPYAGASFGRIGPAASDQTVTLDLDGAVTGPGTYSFAVVSPPSDGNGTHFYSKEGSASAAPSLKISFSVVDGDGDGVPDGPDCNDANAAVNPGASESCNGADDDCDGQTDEGCGASGAGGSGWGAGSGSGGTSAGGTTAQGQADGGGGGCASSGRPPSHTWLFFAIAAAVCGLRRSRRKFLQQRR